MAEALTENTKCLACGSEELETILDLGKQPLANNYETENTASIEYPLAVDLCADCYHLQLTHTVDPGIIYTDYLYRTGTNQTIKDYSDWFARWVTERMGKEDYTVLDVGCNDGTQLDSFGKQATYGIDPAANLAEFRNSKHQCVTGFFSENAIQELGVLSFDVINNQNAFSHLADPMDFLRIARRHLIPGGRIYLSTSQANMVLNNEFDTIYHEHISFYNAYSMYKLARRADLHLTDVVKTPIHGTSYVFELRHEAVNQEHVANVLAVEAAQGLQSKDTYLAWSENVQALCKELVALINLKASEGIKVVGYGAAAKGNTLLNYTQVPLACIIDDSPLKQGLYTPGRHIPIISADQLADYVDPTQCVYMPLAWNFFEEIRTRLQTHLNTPVEFIRYFPKVGVVN